MHMHHAREIEVLFLRADARLQYEDCAAEQCLNVQTFFQGQAIPNIITDLVLLILPLPLIWTLKLPIEQKTALSGVFLPGGL